MKRITTLAAVGTVGLALAVSAGVSPTAATGDQPVEPLARKGPTTWTMISGGHVPSINEPGLFRTGDGMLHVAYGQGPGSTSTTLAWANVGESGRLLGRGTIRSAWGQFSKDPKLVAGPNGGIRAVFFGLGQSAPYDAGRIYTATAGVAGRDWSLAPGALTYEDATTYGTAALAIPGQNPIAAFPENADIYWRQADGQTMPTTPDNHLSNGGCCAYATDLARDDRTGQVLLGWYSSKADARGVFVKRLRPTAGPKVRAPGSGADPHQTVALSGRRGAPGVYAAYCGGTLCQNGVRLWRVGARKSLLVPRSAGADTVAIAPAPFGRLWVVWEKNDTHKVYATLTNTKATRFGAVRVVKSGRANVFGIAAAGGATRRVDIVINGGSALFHRQLLPGLGLTAKPRAFSNDRRHVVTFTVRDAGVPVAGAKVRVAGKTKTTGAKGMVKILFRKGIRPKRYHATATKKGYAAGQALVRVRR
jgi:hypothetical protein